MKNKLLLIVVSFIMSHLIYAQYDDIYYSKKNNKETVKEPATIITQVEKTPASTIIITGADRDVDEYNRRYVEQTSSNMSYQEEEDDFEYTKSLAKYHNTNIYVEDAKVIVDNNTGDIYIQGNKTNSYAPTYYNTYTSYNPYAYYYGYTPYYTPRSYWSMNYHWGLGWGMSYSWGYPYHYTYRPYYAYNPYYYYSPYYYSYHYPTYYTYPKYTYSTNRNSP